ncbi:MAG: glycine-rich domain-containing protein [Pseudomonadota bacterium]
MASTWILTLAALGVIGTLLVRQRFRRKQLQHRLAFIDRFRYPPRLAREAQQRYPHLQAADLARVEQGLKQFFRLCVRANGEMVSMPSQVVDAMWHAWILDTRGYQRFCRLAFGRFLHHTPAEAMRTPTLATRGIQRAWGLACDDEGLSRKRPERVPLLFALDRELAIPGGFYYVADCRRDGGAGQYCGSDIGCGGGSGDGGGDADGGGDGGGCGGGGD